MLRFGPSIIILAVTFIGGCTIQGPKVDPVQIANVVDDAQEMRIDAVGDADDLGPALGIGLGKLNLAVVDATTVNGTTTYQLVDVLDRPAVLRVKRLDSPPNTFRISAAFTRYRDQERERLLVAAIAQRLAELRGVDIAPAR